MPLNCGKKLTKQNKRKFLSNFVPLESIKVGQIDGKILGTRFQCLKPIMMAPVVGGAALKEISWQLRTSFKFIMVGQNSLHAVSMSKVYNDGACCRWSRVKRNFLATSYLFKFIMVGQFHWKILCTLFFGLNRILKQT